MKCNFENFQTGTKRSKSVRTMIILGSGGHTAEMLRLTKILNTKQEEIIHNHQKKNRSPNEKTTNENINLHYAPLLFVYAHNDESSYIKAKSIHNSKTDLYITVPRSRNVGQSYSSSILTTVYSFLHSFAIVAFHRPELIICNGPGTCFPIIITSLILNLSMINKTRFIYIESYCRCSSLSLCGYLVYPFVHRFIVQWENLSQKYSMAEYIGRLC